jgi:hypothetical protein
MARPTGVCPLCGKTKFLCESHVIPEFCYKQSYDEKHRLIVVHASHKKETFRKKGLKEYLLCDDCETFLNTSYEQPFKNYWYDGSALPNPMPPVAQRKDDLFQISGFDYATFKLFHLSILWRASVAVTKEFKAVSLGPYEIKIRKMLLQKDPGPVSHYPIWGKVLLFDLDQRRVVHGLVSMPQVSKVWGHHIYFSCYGGCEWFFAVTDHPTAQDLMTRPNMPQVDGTMLLLVDHWDKSVSGDRMLREWQKAR